jgi:hypothetical protein
MWVWMNGTFGISYEPLTGAIINGVNANHIGVNPYVRVYSPYGASMTPSGMLFRPYRVCLLLGSPIHRGEPLR